MIQSNKTYITPEIKMIDLINDNYSFLLFLQHFNIDFNVDNKTVKDLCIENKIDLTSFIIIGNLYNGFFPGEKDVYKIENLRSVLTFLKNSHTFYIDDKYPELKNYLKEIKPANNNKDFRLIVQFFDNYFSEVLDHLRYEDEVAFPYFYSLPDSLPSDREKTFSAGEYRNHHTDIETKLSDLKNLFLKHVRIKGRLNIKRKFLNTLFGLEFDLKIHSIIEEKILVPIAERIETKRNG